MFYQNSMFRICVLVFISLFSIVLSYLPSISYAGNITESTFKIELAPMDPIGGATRADGSTGVGVLTFFLGSVTDLLLFTIPLLAAISLLFAGYFYIFSAGDSEKLNKAKTIIKWNIIALFLAFFSYGIINLIASLFN